MAAYYRPVSTPQQLIEKNRNILENGCWEWTATVNVNGYGSTQLGGRKGKRVYAHRLSYEAYKGSIPEGLDLDHLCRNRKCVNPDHLEAVSRKINAHRGDGPRAARKYSDELVTEIRLKKQNGATYKQLRAEYGIAESTLCYMCSKTACPRGQAQCY